MRRTKALVGLLSLLLWSASATAAVTSFDAGALVIPMDVGDPAAPASNDEDVAYQSYGMLRAFGLVHALLRAGVRVHWIIEPTKAAYSDVDMSAEVSFTPGPGVGAGVMHDYRAGPFVIDATQADDARAVLASYNSGCQESAAPFCVHVHEARAPFSAPVDRTLTAAPTIGILVDGNEDIAFRYLNAAGLRTSLDTPWPASKCAQAGDVCDDIAEILSEAELAGCPGAASPTDVGCVPDGRSGALFDDAGDPAVCQLMTMHYVVTGWEPYSLEAVSEYLTGEPTHFFAECDAAERFEDSLRLLTTSGIDRVTKSNTADDQINNASPFAQAATRITGTGGSVARWTVLGDPGAGEGYRSTTQVHSKLAGAAVGVSDLWASGVAFGDEHNGKVSLLGGHDYCPSNACLEAARGSDKVGGVRYFLNSLFEAPCATFEGQAVFVLDKEGPADATSSLVTWTVSWENVGGTPGKEVLLVDELPGGSLFVSATGGGSYDEASHTVRWELGRQDAGASAVVSVTARVSDGTWENVAVLTHRVALTTLRVADRFTTVVTGAVPLPPILTSPESGAVLVDATPPVEGAAEPFATVRIYVDGQLVATTTAAPDGSFSASLAAPLSDGEHVVTAVADNAAGSSLPSEGRLFYVDTGAPDAPVVLVPADGSETNDDTPTVAGVAQPGSLVTVYVDDVAVGTVTAADDGSWSFEPQAALDEGEHVIEADAGDGLGNTSARSEPVIVVIDLTAPAAPVLLSPADGTTTSEPAPTLSGTAEPGCVVTIVVDGVVVGSVTADADGGFSLTLDDAAPLAAGPHTISATATDAAGNEGDAASVTFTVDESAADTTAPDTLLHDVPSDPTDLVDVTFGFSSTEADSAFACALDGDAFVTCTSPTTYAALPLGPHAFRVRATDLAGNTDPTPALYSWRVVEDLPNGDGGAPDDDGGVPDGDGGAPDDDGGVPGGDGGVHGGDGGVPDDDGGVPGGDGGVRNGDGGAPDDDGGVPGGDGGAPDDDGGELPGGTCGNGRVERDETCDDGNDEPGDGCDSSCARERGWDCDDKEPSFCVPALDDGARWLVTGGGCACDASDGSGDSAWLALFAASLFVSGRRRHRRRRSPRA